MPVRVCKQAPNTPQNRLTRYRNEIRSAISKSRSTGHKDTIIDHDLGEACLGEEIRGPFLEGAYQEEVPRVAFHQEAFRVEIRVPSLEGPFLGASQEEAFQVESRDPFQEVFRREACREAYREERHGQAFPCQEGASREACPWDRLFLGMEAYQELQKEGHHGPSFQVA